MIGARKRLAASFGLLVLWSLGICALISAVSSFSFGAIAALAGLLLLAIIPCALLCILANDPTSLSPSRAGAEEGSEKHAAEKAVPEQGSTVVMNADEVRDCVFAQHVPLLQRQYDLTQRETEIFRELIHGRNAESISQTLNISHHTVKSHMHSIYQKTDVHSHQELINLFDGVMKDELVELAPDQGERRQAS